MIFPIVQYWASLQKKGSINVLHVVKERNKKSNVTQLIIVNINKYSGFLDPFFWSSFLTIDSLSFSSNVLN